MKAPLRKVLRVTRSPLNPKRWVLDLECGHELWVTRIRRPCATRVHCEECEPDERNRRAR